MPGPLRNALLGAVAATLIAGCGSDDGTIPPQDASTLLSHLDAVEDNVQAGQCDPALAQAEQFSSVVDDLPAQVDDEVRRALDESASNLVTLTASQCEPQEGTSGVGGAVPAAETATAPETTETTTTTGETTTEEETTTEQSPEPAEPETEEPQEDPQATPPTGDQGPGGGNGVGQDGGVSPSSGGVSGGRG